jgi:hypothetical protein
MLRRIEHVYVCLIIIIIIITVFCAVIICTLERSPQYFVSRGKMPWRWMQDIPTKLCYVSACLHGITPQKTAILIFTAVGTSQHGNISPTFRRVVLAPSSGLKSKLRKQEVCFLLASCWLLAFLFGFVDGCSTFLRNVSHRKTINIIVTAMEISNPHTALLHQCKYLVVYSTALSVLQTTELRMIGRLVNNEL